MGVGRGGPGEHRGPRKHKQAGVLPPSKSPQTHLLPSSPPPGPRASLCRGTPAGQPCPDHCLPGSFLISPWDCGPSPPTHCPCSQALSFCLEGLNVEVPTLTGPPGGPQGHRRASECQALLMEPIRGPLKRFDKYWTRPQQSGDFQTRGWWGCPASCLQRGLRRVRPAHSQRRAENRSGARVPRRCPQQKGPRLQAAWSHRRAWRRPGGKACWHQREGLWCGPSSSTMAGVAMHLHASYRRLGVAAGAGGAWGCPRRCSLHTRGLVPPSSAGSRTLSKYTT